MIGNDGVMTSSRGKLTVPDNRPFKPFTLDEVVALTGVKPQVLEGWIKKGLPLDQGEIDFSCTGLDMGKTFAVFVGQKYLEEGSDPIRALATVIFLAHRSLEQQAKDMAAGNNFPVPSSMLPGREGNLSLAKHGSMVPAPNSRLGRALRLDRLVAEFQTRLDRVFPREKA